MKLKNAAEGVPIAAVGLGLTQSEARQLMSALRELLQNPLGQQLVTAETGEGEIAVWIEES